MLQRTQGVDVTVIPGPVLQGRVTPAQALQAFQAKRSELRSQLSALESQRNRISSQLQSRSLNDASREGLEQRLKTVDENIAQVDKQLAEANAEVAQASAVPGAVSRTQQPTTIGTPTGRGSARSQSPWENPPEEFVFLGALFMVVAILPISIASARRIWRRSAKVIASVPEEVMDRFNRLEQAVDAIAVEVERIGEGQRFMTRVFSRHAAPGEALPASLTDEIELPGPGAARRR